MTDSTNPRRGLPLGALSRMYSERVRGPRDIHPALADTFASMKKDDGQVSEWLRDMRETQEHRSDPGLLELLRAHKERKEQSDQQRHNTTTKES